VFAAAIAIFTLASCFCALSTSLAFLTTMRVVQGLGGAMMVPVGRLVVLRGTNKSDLIHAIAYLTWPALVAPVMAPVLGGVLATYASWRWIFVLNLPLGVVALLLTLRMVPNMKNERSTALDWLGFVLLGGGLGLLVYGMELISASDVTWLLVGPVLAAGLALLVIAVRHLLKTQHPLINLQTMRIPTFRITNVGGSFFRMAISAVPFLLPLMFQDAFGWSPVKAGLLVVAVFVGNLGIKPLTTPLLRRFGFRPVLLVTGVAAGVNLAVCGLLRSHTPLPVIVLVLLLSGVFRSIGFTAYNTIAFADIEPDQMADANTLSATIQQLTIGFGVAVGALALRLGRPIGDWLGLPGSTNTAFSVAFVLIALLGLLAVIESALLAPHAGVAVSGARPPTTPSPDLSDTS
jgi:MFS family permease